MGELLTAENIINLGMLIFLQAVLGFDNLLYISIESKRAPLHQQAAVRRWGIIIAVALRIILLFTMIKLLATLTEPFFHLDYPGIVEGSFNFATIVFLFGGVFIIYTALKEIGHMLAIEDLEHDGQERNAKSAVAVVSLIVFMNLVFSFDSILSAIAISDVFAVLATAIIISGIAMLVLADSVSEFLTKNKKYEVLGLFILLIVGIVLLGEGGHVAHLKLFGHAIEPMAKSTFYFSIVVLVIVDIIQSGYQRKLQRQAARERTTTPV